MGAPRSLAWRWRFWGSKVGVLGLTNRGSEAQKMEALGPELGLNSPEMRNPERGILGFRDWHHEMGVWVLKMKVLGPRYGSSGI